ncbi:MAG: hypothetical protein Q4E88_00555, partial [Coriobacteriia bacterium]|nr:hypothetical protein [Coriobacteriia bacterium]
MIKNKVNLRIAIVIVLLVVATTAILFGIVFGEESNKSNSNADNGLVLVDTISSPNYDGDNVTVKGKFFKVTAQKVRAWQGSSRGFCLWSENTSRSFNISLNDTSSELKIKKVEMHITRSSGELPECLNIKVNGGSWDGGRGSIQTINASNNVNNMTISATGDGKLAPAIFAAYNWVKIYIDHTHSFSSEWSADEDGHFHKCTGLGCNIDYSKKGSLPAEAAFAPHSYGTKNEQRWTCQVPECGYVSETLKALWLARDAAIDYISKFAGFFPSSDIKEIIEKATEAINNADTIDKVNDVKELYEAKITGVKDMEDVSRNASDDIKEVAKQTIEKLKDDNITKAQVDEIANLGLSKVGAIKSIEDDMGENPSDNVSDIAKDTIANIKSATVVSVVDTSKDLGLAKIDCIKAMEEAQDNSSDDVVEVSNITIEFVKTATDKNIIVATEELSLAKIDSIKTLEEAQEGASPDVEAIAQTTIDKIKSSTTTKDVDDATSVAKAKIDGIKALEEAQLDASPDVENWAQAAIDQLKDPSTTTKDQADKISSLALSQIVVIKTMEDIAKDPDISSDVKEIVDQTKENVKNAKTAEEAVTIGEFSKSKIDGIQAMEDVEKDPNISEDV